MPACAKVSPLCGQGKGLHGLQLGADSNSNTYSSMATQTRCAAIADNFRQRLWWCVEIMALLHACRWQKSPLVNKKKCGTHTPSLSLSAPYRKNSAQHFRAINLHLCDRVVRGHASPYPLLPPLLLPVIQGPEADRDGCRRLLRRPRRSDSRHLLLGSHR